ncbi:MAG: four helix bundle protein [Patescibacteria group bacterium]|nr:four helix bundle protein [Patescibacteria group bacterium]
MPKKDRHGLHLKIEQFGLDILGFSIEAALLGGATKIPILRKIKIEIEILKRLIRLENELDIINTNKYLDIENQLVEISKMASGWIRYLETKGA